MFGFWKLYFQLIWHRKGSFNQDRKFFLRKQLWKFYQLVCWPNSYAISRSPKNSTHPVISEKSCL